MSSKHKSSSGKTANKSLKIFVSAVLVLLGAVAAYFGIDTGILDNVTSGASVSVPADGSMQVHFIDVGQGDAALIVTGSGETMLIDAGTSSSADSLVEYLKTNNIDSLDYAVFTHPHEDHIGGADDVLNQIPVDTVLMPDCEADTANYRRMISAITSCGAQMVVPKPGETYTLGDASFKIYAPNSESYESTNDYSIVLRLVYGQTSVMFTGDAEEDSEFEILEAFRASELKSDILKVGHHGSSTSSSVRFLQAVSPATAIISCGLNNDYGHPHAITLRKLGDLGCDILRTDETGTIVFVSDGKSFTRSDKNAA